MAIPPFPSQDLAKLVLGYLAEEQLMTAYDEFLQASPYLDAMRNEYDRIFMTSLKNILAEYRAVKIFVETCKPVLLRRKLFQCMNLLEIVKFLVNNIDVDKLIAQDCSKKSSVEKHNVSFRSVGCDVCNSLKLAKCVCKERQNAQNTGNEESTSHSEQNSLQSSIETTPLADLPGNNLTVRRKKQAKTIEKKTKYTRQKNGNTDENDLNAPQAINIGCITNCGSQPFLTKSSNLTGHLNIEQSSTLCNSNVQPTCVVGSARNLNECNITNDISNNVGKFSRNNRILENKTISSSFQDFASGVKAGCENRNAIVPDSSTSDSTHLQTPGINNSTGYQRETQIVLKIEPLNKKLVPQGNGSVPTISTSYGQIKSKIDDQRIKILSDVKVDNTNERKLIPASRNATSTPLMQMQTIVINGTPAYKPHPIHAQQQNFTRDEIMAMPTIIVVPASGPPQLTSSQTAPIVPHSSNSVKVQSDPAKKVLSPLVIDVSTSSSEEKEENKQSSEEPVTVGKEVGLIKTVDNSVQQKMTSLPKNNNMICSTETTSTPLVMPPLRKSSSTPRRTSHVRVLDFTTPRRILHETIVEQGAFQVNDKPVDVIVSKSNNIIISERPELSKCENNVQKLDVPKLVPIPSKSSAETVLKNKKNNWDHDLRAMIANDNDVSKVKSKPRLKSAKKKKMSRKNSTDKEDKQDSKNDGLEKKTKGRKIKKRQIIEEEDEVPNLPSKPDSVPVKPTINIKPAVEWEPSSASATKKEIETNQIKIIEDEHIETPEVDRIALQNVIGSKLNISDLLETPYKQVFYDIQMGTPRFFGPDVAGEPMSDIKIMSIPTPRFFNSPKIAQATPSSYSSRPTDYSSGGSYYKPDDQDYLPIPDIRCPVTSSKEEFNVEVPKGEVIDKKNARPVRQCAKNVSYYASNKVRDCEDRTDVASTCSETTNATSSLEIKVPKDKTVKGTKVQDSTKVERTKRSGRKKKSPMAKEKPKTFMKIKPRRVTPTKETLSGKSRRNTLLSSSPKLQRKRTTSKDKNLNITPIVTLIPTKSRRKSSTPRKLNCSKTFNSESSGHDSPEISNNNKQQNTTRDTHSINTQESDTEQLNLRWSDDGSQDMKLSEVHKNVSESEDISKIQEYIQTTVAEEPIVDTHDVSRTPLVKKGFDEITAKIIERDLSDTPPRNEIRNVVQEEAIDSKEQAKVEGTSDKSIETDTKAADELQIIEDSVDDDEIELSVHETNEDTSDWRLLKFNYDTEAVCKHPTATLKDTFSMEVCIEDGLAIRLRATPFNSIFELESTQDNQPFCDKEIEEAVKSISNIDKLYTPLKDSIKAQCYEIFDSTLTSLDTPLKANSPKKVEREITVTEITLEIEKTENKEKTESKKRKRLQNSNDSDDVLNESKKAKPDTQYLLATANIQNIDIESVLKKLHGP